MKVVLEDTVTLVNLMTKVIAPPLHSLMTASKAKTETCINLDNFFEIINKKKCGREQRTNKCQSPPKKWFSKEERRVT